VKPRHAVLGTLLLASIVGLAFLTPGFAEESQRENWAALNHKAPESYAGQMLLTLSIVGILALAGLFLFLFAGRNAPLREESWR